MLAGLDGLDLGFDVEAAAEPVLAQSPRKLKGAGVIRMLKAVGIAVAVHL
jgi:hypothetical protein